MAWIQPKTFLAIAWLFCLVIDNDYYRGSPPLNWGINIWDKHPGTWVDRIFNRCLKSRCSSAIKCWDCRSDVDPRCADPFDNSTFPISDCSFRPDGTQGPNKCKKVKQDDGLVIRSCALATETNVPTNCTKAKNDKGILVETCYCDNNNGCNFFGDSNAAISTFPLVGLVAALLLGVITLTAQ